MAGPPEQVGVAPESKEGLLWETYRKLAGDGFRLDDAGYSVSFRVKLKVCWCLPSSALARPQCWPWIRAPDDGMEGRYRLDCRVCS